MNIPPKYEDVVAELETERLRADVAVSDCNDAERREAALREELDALRESYEAMRDRKSSIVDLQQRLTVAEQALKFYADGDHLLLADADAWDTCSGEPVNFLHDEAGTASVEDGSIAKAALKPAAEGEGTKPQEAYEVFPDSPGGYYNGCPPSALADPMQCWRDGYEIAKKRAITAGLKVKP